MTQPRRVTKRALLAQATALLSNLRAQLRARHGVETSDPEVDKRGRRAFGVRIWVHSLRLRLSSMLAYPGSLHLDAWGDIGRQHPMLCSGYLEKERFESLQDPVGYVFEFLSLAEQSFAEERAKLEHHQERDDLPADRN